MSIEKFIENIITINNEIYDVLFFNQFTLNIYLISHKNYIHSYYIKNEILHIQK